MPDFLRRHPALCLLTAAYVAAGLVVCTLQRNWEFLLYVVQMMALVGFILWADRRARFSTRTLWLLSAWGLLHLAGGIVPVPVHLAQVNDADKTRAVLYGLWFVRDVFKYDNLVHGFGFFAATLAVGESLRPFLDPAVPLRLALFVIVACAGMGLGAINEMIEFAATILFPRTGVGGYANNALDLCWNALGAMAAAGLAVRSWRLPRSPG
jgi:putative membrane protein